MLVIFLPTLENLDIVQGVGKTLVRDAPTFSASASTSASFR
jgi:hypothetical protein